MTEYAILFLIVLGVNLLPAFGPPTWTILVWYKLTTDLGTVPVVIIGAGAAAAGRFFLGSTFRLFGTRLSEKTRRNLEAARNALEARKGNLRLALALFALSPIPSAALFEAAGLAGMRLLPFTAAFFAGRVLSYSVYAYTAGQIRHTSFGDALREGFTSPLGIAVQLLLIGLLVALTRIDWARWLATRPQAQGSAHRSGATNVRRASTENKHSGE